MSDLVVVTKAEYVDAYRLNVTFSDGVRADIDFAKWIKNYPFFEPLKDIDYFKQFSLDGWTVSWPNGADIAPETLHQIALKTRSPQAA